MTTLSWKNESDRLAIIKTFNDSFVHDNGVLHNISAHEAQETLNKYLPWLISRVDELEKEMHEILTGQRQVFVVHSGESVHKSDLVEEFAKAVNEND